MHTEVTAGNTAGRVASCEIDHTVPPSTAFRGGRGQAEERIETFLKQRLSRYARDKNEPSHRNDKRNPCYTREQFEGAETYDGLWNAAQKELLLRGTIVEWSESAATDGHAARNTSRCMELAGAWLAREWNVRPT